MSNTENLVPAASSRNRLAQSSHRHNQSMIVNKVGSVGSITKPKTEIARIVKSARKELKPVLDAQLIEEVTKLQEEARASHELHERVQNELIEENRALTDKLTGIAET